MKNLEQKKRQAQRGGFTLFEVLIYVGILSVTSALLVGILNTLVRVQNQSTSLIDVSNQSQFILQTIQRKVRDSSVFYVKDTTSTTPLDQDAASFQGSALRLRMSDHTKGITNIYLVGNTVRLSEKDESLGVETTTDLNDSHVNVTSLTFTKRTNPPGKDTLLVSTTIAYNTTNASLLVTRNFESAISRVAAAVFDLDILPSNDNGTTTIGTSTQQWGYGYFKNNLIVSGKVGIKNNATGTADLDVTGQLAVSATGTFNGISVSGRVQQGGADLVASGTIMFYISSTTCPSGWTEYTTARGRYIVGLVSGGTLATTTGSALGNMENRVVGPHTHTLIDPGHAPTIRGGGSAGTVSEPSFSGSLGPDGNVPLPASFDVFGNVNTGITVANTGNNISATSGTNVPYIQLLACQKT